MAEYFYCEYKYNDGNWQKVNAYPVVYKNKDYAVYTTNGSTPRIFAIDNDVNEDYMLKVLRTIPVNQRNISVVLTEKEIWNVDCEIRKLYRDLDVYIYNIQTHMKHIKTLEDDVYHDIANYKERIRIANKAIYLKRTKILEYDKEIERCEKKLESLMKQRDNNNV